MKQGSRWALYDWFGYVHGYTTPVLMLALYREIAHGVFGMIAAIPVIMLMLSHVRPCACMLDDCPL